MNSLRHRSFTRTSFAEQQDRNRTVRQLAHYDLDGLHARAYSLKQLRSSADWNAGQSCALDRILFMNDLPLARGAQIAGLIVWSSTVWATNPGPASIAPESQRAAVFNYLEACDFGGTTLLKTTTSRTK